MQKRMMILVAALVVAIVLAACAAPTQPNSSAEQPSLSGTTWTLTELNGAVPLPGHVPTLEFGTDGQATGNSGCNQYFGSYTVNDDTLNFGQLGSTMMGCEEPVMQQEMIFLETLGTSAIFTINGDTLTITTAADATLVFTKVA
jgi:heat shock protein HslJ